MMQMTFMNKLCAGVLLLSCSVLGASAQVLHGRVVDAESGDELPGATVRVVQTKQAVTTDEKGTFELRGLGQRSYTVEVYYISYEKSSLTVSGSKLPDTTLVVRMQPAENALGTATVTGHAVRNTDMALTSVQRNSLVVQSGVSAQLIRRTQDKDASEVIRRVPGISVIDQKFVMVRGLSQRYNNVWINGSACLLYTSPSPRD